MHEALNLGLDAVDGSFAEVNGVSGSVLRDSGIVPVPAWTDNVVEQHVVCRVTQLLVAHEAHSQHVNGGFVQGLHTIEEREAGCCVNAPAVCINACGAHNAPAGTAANSLVQLQEKREVGAG